MLETQCSQVYKPNMNDVQLMPVLNNLPFLPVLAYIWWGKGPCT